MVFGDLDLVEACEFKGLRHEGSEIRETPKREMQPTAMDIFVKKVGIKGTIDSGSRPWLSAGRFSGFRKEDMMKLQMMQPRMMKEMLMELSRLLCFPPRMFT